VFRLGYNIALHLYALAMLPKVGWEAWRHGKYRKSFAAKLGKGFPKIEAHGKPVIWVHAVSLGETKAVAPLVAKLREHGFVLLSTATETGHQEGKKNIPADAHVYLPFDLPYIIRPIVQRVRPSLVVLVESDFWFHFQSAAKQLGAKLVLVNGKLSERSFKRFRWLPFLSRRFFGDFDTLCVQNEVYQQRFCALGVPQNRVIVTGNIKLDAPVPELTPLSQRPEDFILTLGSTHDPEEKLWLEALKGCQDVKAYLVPRHPERFGAVAQMLQASGFSWGRWSEGATLEQVQIVLVDAMGVLQRCYQASDLAFVGGSLTPRVGGHNILEPSMFGVPVLYGPYLWGQRDFLELIQRYEGGREVHASDLHTTVLELKENPEVRQRMGEGGKCIFTHASGALQKTYQQMLGLN